MIPVMTIIMRMLRYILILTSIPLTSSGLKQKYYIAIRALIVKNQKVNKQP